MPRVLRRPESVRGGTDKPPAALLDWADPRWDGPAGEDWAVLYRAGVEQWAVTHGFTLPDGESADWRRLTREFGVRVPRRLVADPGYRAGLRWSTGVAR